MLTQGFKNDDITKLNDDMKDTWEISAWKINVNTTEEVAMSRYDMLTMSNVNVGEKMRFLLPK